MKKPVTLLLLLLSFVTGLSARDSFDSLLSKGVNQLGKKVDGTMVVCFGNFTYSDQKIGSSFSVYLENNLGIQIEKSPVFNLFAKDQLESIVETIDLSLDDLFDEETSVEPGQLQGIQGLITGNFFDNKKSVDVYISLIDVEQGLVLGRTKVAIKKKMIPSSVSIKPTNL
jgi:hypothetical protein